MCAPPPPTAIRGYSYSANVNDEIKMYCFETVIVNIFIGIHRPSFVSNFLIRQISIHLVRNVVRTLSDLVAPVGKKH